MNILIIDDDPLSLSGVKMMLEQQGGHHCAAFPDPEAALREFRLRPFDAVITDLRMPGMSGLEVLRRLHEINPAVPVILISGHEFELTEPDAREIHAFFPKPLRAQLLLKALDLIAAGKAN